ncbi:uncharacterized protein B0T23DRAFT_390532 [Neurospora hispaniola]|uniref:DUF7735 domain-containing protein n=1 Tax=Neurospora hispaniola TaxID=588809 RepID=A0AAJ0HYZ9_9PEZI|nr:hypothetical protein B0T23DRAFT_390532 [Neurospora hispaniola]
MRSNTLLVALAATASASAVPQPRAEAPGALITPAPIFKGSAVQGAIRAHGQQAEVVDKRAYEVSVEISGSGSQFTSCVYSISSVLRSIQNAAPYPSDTDLASWILTAVPEESTTTLGLNDAGKACETSDMTTPAVPTSLTSAFSSYESEAEAWLTEAAKGASSVAGNCPTKVRDWVELSFATNTAECKAIVARLQGKSGAGLNSAPVLAAVAAFTGLVGVLAL